MIGKLALVLLGSCMLLGAKEAPKAALDRGVESFHRAYRQWSAKGFDEAADRFHKLTLSHPQSATARYWLGLARFHHLLVLQQGKDKAQRKAAQTEMDRAIETLESATELDPEIAEAHAILATLYGMKIDGSMMRGMRYGRRVQQHHKLALKHGPGNPRVHYLAGAGLFHTAKTADDLAAALKELQLAATLYQAEQGGNRKAAGSGWGHDACHTFIGDTHRRLGEPDKARPHYLRAIRINASNRSARAALASLPN